MALTTPDQVTFTPLDTGGLLATAAADATVDNIFIYASAQSPTGKVRRVIDGSYRASWAGVLSTVSAANNTTRLNAVLSNAGVKEVIFDTPEGGDIPLSGTISAAGKTIKVSPGSKFVNTYTIQNAVIDAPYDQFILGGTPTLTNVTTTSGNWSPKWRGALGDGSTDDYAAFNSINNIAAASSQKNVLVLGSAGKYVINSALSVAEGVTWNFDGGVIGSTNASTITFNQRWDAPIARIFDDNIIIKCGYLGACLDPIQFGAFANGVGDDTLAIEKAIVAMNTSGLQNRDGFAINLFGNYRFNGSNFTYNGRGLTFNCNGFITLTNTWIIGRGINVKGVGGSFSQYATHYGCRIETVPGLFEVQKAAMSITGGYNILTNIDVWGRWGIGIDMPPGGAVTKLENVHSRAIRRVADEASAGIRMINRYWTFLDRVVAETEQNAENSTILMQDSDPTPGIGGCYLITIRDSVIQGSPIRKTATAGNGSAGSYSVLIDGLTYENLTTEFLYIDSTYTNVFNWSIKNVTSADSGGATAYINNTGLNTFNFVVENLFETNYFNIVKGTPIRGLHCNNFISSFVGNLGAGSKKTQINPSLTTLEQRSGALDAYNFNKGLKSSFNTVIGVANSGFNKTNAVTYATQVSNPYDIVTSGQPSWDGTSNAFIVQKNTVNPTDNRILVTADQYNASWVDGDWVVAMFWAKNGNIPLSETLLTGGGFYFAAGTTSIDILKTTTPNMFVGTGSANAGWQMVMGVAKVSASSSFIQLVLRSIPQSGTGQNFYFTRPMMWRVAGTSNYTDDEVIRWAKELSEGVYDVPVGSKAVALKNDIYLGGNIRFNSTTNTLQYFQGGNWVEAGSAYTFQDGLTATGAVVTNDLITGKAGGQTITSGTGSGENLIINTNGTVTKGRIYLDPTVSATSSAYDQATQRLGIGTNAPSCMLQIVGGDNIGAIKVGASLSVYLQMGLLSSAYRIQMVGNSLAISSSTAGVDVQSGGNASIRLLPGGTGQIGLGATPSGNAKAALFGGTATMAPIKFLTPTALLTTPEIGCFEFLTDKYYLTITTSTARKEIALNDIALTSGRVAIVTTNGRISDDAGLLYDPTSDFLTSRYVANAGTATAGTAPIKLTAGVLLTTPESGALETNSNNALFYTNGSVRGKVQVNTNLVSGAGTLALSELYSFYTFNGTTSTWTLPAVAGFTGIRITIINSGSGIITLNSNAGGNDIWESGTPTNTISINPGEIYILYNNSLNWVVVP